MYQFNCMAQNATACYESFQFAKTWAGKLNGIVTFVDKAMGTTHTWVEFEKVQMYFPHFRIGDKSLGSEALIEILVDLGVDQENAETEVRESKKYLSVTRIRMGVEDSATGMKVDREGWRVSRKHLKDDPFADT